MLKLSIISSSRFFNNEVGRSDYRTNLEEWSERYLKVPVKLTFLSIYNLVDGTLTEN